MTDRLRFVCLVDIEELCEEPSLSFGISYHADKW